MVIFADFTAVPVFDCTRYFQPRRGEFASMKSLADFFAQVGEDACPQIHGKELKDDSFVAVCYTVNKWGSADAPAGNMNLGLNVLAVYLLVDGIAK